MRLLCATDLSSRSDRAVRRAAILAKETGAELVLLSVVDDDRPELLLASERRDVTRQLADQARGMPEMQGLNPRLRVEVGDPFDAIIRAADEEKADLVVMGEHRRRLLRDMFIGTTIERVMRLGGRPVLMVNRPSERPYLQVLAAVDISEPSASALRAATPRRSSATSRPCVSARSFVDVAGCRQKRGSIAPGSLCRFPRRTECGGRGPQPLTGSGPASGRSRDGTAEACPKRPPAFLPRFRRLGPRRPLSARG